MKENGKNGRPLDGAIAPNVATRVVKEAKGKAEAIGRKENLPFLRP
jgi:hypothetical protein